MVSMSRALMKNISFVQCLARAKIVFNTSDNNEWTVRAAKTVEEATELMKVGFEYHVEIDGVKLFRKRK